MFTIIGKGKFVRKYFRCQLQLMISLTCNDKELRRIERNANELNSEFAVLVHNGDMIPSGHNVANDNFTDNRTCAPLTKFAVSFIRRCHDLPLLHAGRVPANTRLPVCYNAVTEQQSKGTC